MATVGGRMFKELEGSDEWVDEKCEEHEALVSQHYYTVTIKYKDDSHMFQLKQRASFAHLRAMCCRNVDLNPVEASVAVKYKMPPLDGVDSPLLITLSDDIHWGTLTRQFASGRLKMEMADVRPDDSKRWLFRDGTMSSLLRQQREKDRTVQRLAERLGGDAAQCQMRVSKFQSLMGEPVAAAAVPKLCSADYVGYKDYAKLEPKQMQQLCHSRAAIMKGVHQYGLDTISFLERGVEVGSATLLEHSDKLPHRGMTLFSNGKAKFRSIWDPKNGLMSKASREMASQLAALEVADSAGGGPDRRPRTWHPRDPRYVEILHEYGLIIAEMRAASKAFQDLERFVKTSITAGNAFNAKSRLGEAAAAAAWLGAFKNASPPYESVPVMPPISTPVPKDFYSPSPEKERPHNGVCYCPQELQDKIDAFNRKMADTNRSWSDAWEEMVQAAGDVDLVADITKQAAWPEDADGEGLDGERGGRDADEQPTGTAGVAPLGGGRGRGGTRAAGAGGVPEPHDAPITAAAGADGLGCNGASDSAPTPAGPPPPRPRGALNAAAVLGRGRGGGVAGQRRAAEGPPEGQPGAQRSGR